MGVGFKTVDKLIVEHLTSEYPPTNKVLLDKWRVKTKSPALKDAIDEWKEILDNKRLMFSDRSWKALTWRKEKMKLRGLM